MAVLAAVQQCPLAVQQSSSEDLNETVIYDLFIMLRVNLLPVLQHRRRHAFGKLQDYACYVSYPSKADTILLTRHHIFIDQAMEDTSS